MPRWAMCGAVVGVRQRIERAGANRLRDVQPAVHHTRGVCAAHGDGTATLLTLHPDRIALRDGLGFGGCSHAERNADRVRGRLCVGVDDGQPAAGGLTADFLHREFPRPGGSGIEGEREGRRGEGWAGQGVLSTPACSTPARDLQSWASASRM